MKLTLHKSQVHSYTVSCSDELPIHSCSFLCLQRRVAKVVRGLFYCWSLLRNNTMATNLQGSLHITVAGVLLEIVTWDCWTHTSWQVMQRVSDMLIAVGNERLYFVKRNTSESIARLQQVLKLHYYCKYDHCAWVWNYTYAGFFHAVQNYIVC